MEHDEFIRSSGHADTVVFMIHGIMGTPRHFDRFLSAIPDDWDICNILLDGHGGSVKDFAGASMEKWQRQVDTRLAQLSAQYENVVVLAHSMGTLLAMGAAEKYPEKIRKMVFLAVPLRIAVKLVMVRRALRYTCGKLDANHPWESALRDAGSVAADRRVWRYLGTVPRYIELLKLSVRSRKRVLHVPCLVFQSRKDELVSVKSVKYFASAPCIQCRILENSGHFYYAPQDIDSMLTEIKDFLL